MSVAATLEDFDLRIPGGWERRPLTACNTITLEARPAPAMRVPLLRIVAADGILTAVRPVEVKISREDDQYLVEAETLHVFACAASVDDALRDLSTQILYFFNFYTSSPESDLIGLATHLKAIYVSNFERAVRG